VSYIFVVQNLKKRVRILALPDPLSWSQFIFLIGFWLNSWNVWWTRYFQVHSMI